MSCCVLGENSAETLKKIRRFELMLAFSQPQHAPRTIVLVEIKATNTRNTKSRCIIAETFSDTSSLAEFLLPCFSLLLANSAILIN